MLEFDFFRYKVAGLRADPPSDPQRIPRNESRVMEFQGKYDALNAKLKQALTGLMSTGERLCSLAHQMMAVELNRFADESGRAWKAANIIAEKIGTAAPVLAIMNNNNNNNSVSSGSTATPPPPQQQQYQQQSVPTAAPLPFNNTNNQQPEQQQQQYYHDNKSWNQTQSTFNFNQHASYQQQEQLQQQDPLANTTSSVNFGGVSGTATTAVYDPNAATTLATAPARPPPVATPKERGSRTTVREDDPFRM